MCGGPRLRNKYTDAALYLLMHHGVFCPQAAGFVLGRKRCAPGHDTRGGNYLLRALQDIEDLMRDAARRMDDELFTEYWGASCPPCDRIVEWPRRASAYTDGWRPSEHLLLAN